MGDPRRLKKKYHKPRHPWQKSRIEEEAVLMKEYGLKNKRELWKMSSHIAAFKQQAKALIARRGLQADKEKVAFIERLKRLNLIKDDASVDEVLDLTTRDILEHRLQTVVHRKGLAKTSDQARQFIVHRHITIHGQRINVPSYLVKKGEETEIMFDPQSPLTDPDHPERKREKLVEKPKEPELEEEPVKEAEA